MDSKEVTSLSTGSYSSSSPYSNDSSVETNALVADNKISSTSSNKSGSDDEGFMSGPEEFEPASDKPVEDQNFTSNVNSADPLSGSSGSALAEGSKVIETANVSVEDDVEKSNIVGGPEGGEAVGDKFGGSSYSSVLMLGLPKAEALGEVGEDEDKVGGVEGKPEIEVSSGGLKLNFDEAVKESGGDNTQDGVFEGSEGGGGGQANLADNIVFNEENDEVEEEKFEEAVGAVVTSDATQEMKDVPEVAEDNSFQSDAAGNVKFTAEGDSVVEAINVGLSRAAPGVAVVGELEERKETSKTEGTYVQAAASLEPNEGENERRTAEVDSEVESINSGLTALIKEMEEYENTDPGIVNAAELEVVDGDGVKRTAEGDSIVEAINVELSPAVPGVAVVKEIKEDNEDVEAAEPQAVSSVGLNLTSEGDSIVEDINVKLPVEGVAVVGETADDDHEVLVNGSVGLASRINEENEAAVEVADDLGTGVGDQVAKLPTPRDIIDRDLKSDDFSGKGGMLDAENIDEEPKKENVRAPPPKTESRDNGTVPKVGVNSDDGYPEKAGHEVGTDREDGYTAKTGADGVNLGGLEDEFSDEVGYPQSAERKLALGPEERLEAEDNGRRQIDEEGYLEGSMSDEDTDGMIFGSSEAAKQFIEELERGSGAGSHSGAESSHDHSQRMDGQIVTDSDEEAETDEEGDGKEMFDSAALAALLKAATGADSDGGNITITSQDGSRLFSVERPAGLGSSLRSMRPAPRQNRPNLFAPSTLSSGGEAESNLSEEEKKKLEKLQQIRVKFLRLVQRLGVSPEESVAAQVLYRLALVAGRQTGQLFSMDAAKRMASDLEADANDDLDFAVNILVLGKSGVGKSATINSIFGENKAVINAFEPATPAVREINGYVDGVKLRVFDTPGLKSSVMEQALNRSILSSIKKLTKKNPPDIVLYVDRLDAQTRDLNDLPLLRTITGSLGNSIWQSAIVTLTHAASAPPDGPSGSPLSYEVFVTQRSHIVQQSIGQAVGDLRMMSPSLMNPVSLVENHPSCRKNREGQKILPNGQSWRPQLLLLCYSMKILSEASSLSKPQDPFDHRKLFGFRTRSPPLPYMLSTMLQSRAHPKLSAEQGGDNGDSDIDLDDFSDSDQEEEDEYDQLPPFKPLRKAQLAKLSKEQRKAYFDEYDYRVKLLQKKQWKEELRRMKEMKKKGNDVAIDYGYAEEDADSAGAAPVAVPLPDMVLPPSFDSDNPAYRYRFLEPTSQFLARPVLDTHGWDHDCGYDGVNLEQSLAIASRFPATVTVQITKDKKDFSISLDSSIAAKHGENGSTMAGFDIQSIGKQLAYIVRGETKFKNLKKNKTAGGISLTFLGENVVPGVKIEDQITLGKQYALVGSAGAVRSQSDTAYGANFELQRRELDYPIGQVQSTLSMSVIKWRGDLALGFNSMAQFSIGRNSKVAVRAGINNKLSGQITVRTSSSDSLSLALAAVVPTALAIYRKLWPDVGDKYSIY